MRATPFVVAAAAAALVLSACGGASAALDDVSVTGEETPSIEAKDISVDESTTKVLTEGDGAAVGENDTVEIKYLVANGTSGKEIDSSFAGDSTQMVALGEPSILPGFKKGLVGQNVGSRVLVAVAPADGTEKLPDPSQLGLEKGDTMLFVFDIVSIVPTKLEGGTKKKAPAALPQLELKDDVPSGFTKTDATPAKVKKSTKHVLIEGDGEPVGESSTVTSLYLGQKFPDGEIFDGNFESGSPATFTMGQLIPCWNDLLPGTKVGSRVVLECTAKDAYGTDESSGRPTGDLIFVVDVLASR